MNKKTKKIKRINILLICVLGVLLVGFGVGIWWNYFYNPTMNYGNEEVELISESLYKSCLKDRDYRVYNEYFCRCLSDNVAKNLKLRNYRKRDFYPLLEAANTYCNEYMQYSKMPETELVSMLERICMEKFRPSQKFCHCLATNQVNYIKQYDNDVAIDANMNNLTLKSIKNCE